MWRTWKNTAAVCRDVPASIAQRTGYLGWYSASDGDVPGRVEAGEPDTLGRLEELGVDLLPAQPGILIQADDLSEELARQVGLVGVGGIGRLDGGRLGEDASEDRERGAASS